MGRIDADPSAPDARDAVVDGASTGPAHQVSQAAGSTNASEVSVTIGGGSATTWTAAVVHREFSPVTSVNGLGLAWTRVESQCGAENKSGVDVWTATGTAGAGSVTAELGQTSSQAAIAVSRFSGVQSIGTVVTANTRPDGTCPGGDQESDGYTFPIDPLATLGLIYVAVGNRNESHTPGPGFSEHAEIHAGTGIASAGVAVASGEIDGQDVVAVSGGFGGNDEWGAVAVELRP